MARSEIISDINQETRRMSTLFLGFAAAAIGFGVHEVSTWSNGWPLLPAAIGGACWASSFYWGVEWVHAQQGAMKANVILNGTATNDPRHAAAKEKWISAASLSKRLYARQLYALLAGALLFAVAQGMRVVIPNADNLSNARRCLAIQRDMLSSVPLRADSSDLFTALACKPQGNGNVYADYNGSSRHKAEQVRRKLKILPRR